MTDWFQKQWAGFTYWHIVLIPLSWLFGMVVGLRRYLYKRGCLKNTRLPVPVIVVGNINIGGTGKTPLVIWLAEQMKLRGYRPGVISRGYGGNALQVSEVFPDSDALVAGDEAVLIAARTNCPVFVSTDRISAGQHLLKAHPECNIIISDDGLQHYRMQRDVEIVVYDSAKGFGNGALLPAGPLRESQDRLKTVDAIVRNGAEHGKNLHGITSIDMRLVATDFYNLADHQLKSAAQAFIGRKIIAVAGIGNPQRFFDQLSDMGLQFENRAYADHYIFQAQDFAGVNADAILMTEKDAVKCKPFAAANFWVLPVNAQVDNGLMPIVLNKLNRK
ncbi:tetraacyldisaccharide 4'-kinase [Methylotenera sp. G11]|uniref:tetraacyldisaccharide 4'-kinase n=1 Tax=Methylotenera sp. G11 TaxID=1506585 RepID=UPI0006491780|nr:tetraacyldisaccharide 4'-kinase [Methylotenera sp. G11]